MKISGIRTFLVDSGLTKQWLFVKMDTDEGISGWGEAYAWADRERSIEYLVQQMGRYLVGRDPFQIKHFTHVMYRDFAGKRGSMEFYCALSGVEQAMWDIVGKKLCTPVYNLLGGACRDKIRVYANAWFHGGEHDELATNAVGAIERGFTALKFDPFPGSWRTHIGKEEEQTAIQNVRSVREAVGPEIDILVEVHRRLAPMHAVRVAHALEEFDVFWYEEPVASENIDALAEVRQRIDIPVVTGEALYAKAGFREVFARRAADIINPDVCNCGGILELKEIAAMAEPYYVIVSPHNFNSTTIGLAATLQVAACIPNFLITEYFVSFADRGDEISVHPFQVEDGYIQLPTTPGLGLELDEDALARYPYREVPPRDIP